MEQPPEGADLALLHLQQLHLDPAIQRELEGLGAGLLLALLAARHAGRRDVASVLALSCRQILLLRQEGCGHTARKGRNPQTGEEIDIPASRSLAFKASK